MSESSDMEATRPGRKSRWRAARRFVAVTALVLGLIALAAHFVTPWPSVLLIRAAFDRGAMEASTNLERHVPPGIRVERDLVYDPAGPSVRLDLIRAPEGSPPGPTIVWIHGGGFVSGRRGDVENYLKVLAGQGFNIVNIHYTIAPGATYPTPVRQANAALGFVAREGPRLGLDPNRIVIGGDSAGAQISAQVANLVTSPEYARQVGIAPSIRPDQLRGALLFCGVYDIGLMGNGWLARTMGWAYSGRRDFSADAGFRLASVANHVTPEFPPTFISAGNGDPLLAQSERMDAALRAQGVTVEGLYFPGHQPPLGHEYQFVLDDDAGREALRRAVDFARRVG